MSDGLHWVGTWTAAPAPAEGVAFSNQTLRMHRARQPRRPDVLRVRLSNAHGTRPLAVGAAHVGAARRRRGDRAGHRIAMLTLRRRACGDDRRRLAADQRPGAS